MTKRSAPLAARIALLLLAYAIALQVAHAAGTVGLGNPASCTEASLDAALVGGGAVTFNCGGAATITFTATKAIAVATTITGSAGIVLDGGGAVRLFNVSGGGLSLDHITLANGHDTVTNIGAAAISAGANVTITDSTVSGHVGTNGGCPAIAISGATLAITRSTITGNINAAPAAGFAICGNNTATVNITSSTFTGNTGGALFTSGNATVVNSTIAGNTSTGSGNTGGIQSDGTVTLRNSIVANNVGTGQCNVVSPGTVVDGGGNLQFPDNGCGAGILVADPQLGALASNGGPTQTMALAATSPAIDVAVLANCPATDQRGQATNADGLGCDVGAYETAAPRVFVPAAGVPTLQTALLASMMLLLAVTGIGLLRRD